MGENRVYRGKVSILLLFLLVLAIPAIAEVVLESNTGGAYVAINTSSNERMRVTSTGRLGFNTTNPTTAFDIGGGTYSHLISAGTTNSLGVKGNLEVLENLYANVVIGTYTVKDDSHTAMGVMDSSSNRIFNVDTIDQQVTVSGFGSHISDTDNYAELLVEDDAQINDDLRVGDRISVGTTTRYNYNRIGPGADPPGGTRIGDHIASNDFNTNADTIMMGNLGVVGDLYADAIIGASTIDATNHNAFVVSPYNDLANWVLNVDTIHDEVNVSGDLTATDSLYIGGDGVSKRDAYNRIGTGTKTEGLIEDNDDLYVTGDVEINGKLYANVVIGTYSVQSNNDPAFEVTNDSAYQIFGVNTIDGSVIVTGNTWDLTDSDTHNELQVTDDAYISDDLIVGDVFNVGNGGTTNRYNYNRIGGGTPNAGTMGATVDLYVTGDVEIDTTLDVDGTTNLDNTDIDGTLDVRDGVNLGSNIAAHTLNIGNRDTVNIGYGTTADTINIASAAGIDTINIGVSADNDIINVGDAGTDITLIGDIAITDPQWSISNVGKITTGNTAVDALDIAGGADIEGIFKAGSSNQFTANNGNVDIIGDLDIDDIFIDGNSIYSQSALIYLYDNGGSVVNIGDGDDFIHVAGGYASTGVTFDPDGDIHIAGDIYQTTGKVFYSDATRYNGDFEIADTLKIGVGATGAGTDYLTIDGDGWLTDNDDDVTVGENLDVTGSVATSGTYRAGSLTQTAYNHLGSGGTANYANDNPSDLYVQDQLEVDGNVNFGDALSDSVTIAGTLNVASTTDLNAGVDIDTGGAAVTIDGGVTKIGSGGSYVKATGAGELGVAGDLEVLGHLYANVVIGTYTVKNNSHTALGVMDSDENRIFNVDTIHDEVNVTGDLVVTDAINVGGDTDGTRYAYNRIGSGANPPGGTRIGDHISAGDFDTNDDTIMMGNLGVVGELYADAIVGATKIDDTDHNAFMVMPYNDEANWVFNVDTTAHREVNVSGDFVVNDAIYVGGDGASRRDAYNRIGTGTPNSGTIANNDDLYVTGDVEIDTNLDVDGTTNLDNTDIDGTLDVSTTSDLHGAVHAYSTIRADSDIYTTGAGDDLWLGNSAQGSANFRAYATGEVHIDADSIPITFGEGQDADIYYDGTNLQIDSSVVGSGNAVFSDDVIATLDVSAGGDVISGDDVLAGDDVFVGGEEIRSNNNLAMHLDDNNDGTSYFQIFDGTNNEIVYVDESGNMGIDGDLTVSGGDGTFGTNTLAEDSTLKLNALATQEKAIHFQDAGVTDWKVYNPASSTDLRLNNGGDKVTITSGGSMTLVGNLAVNGDTITTDGDMTLNPAGGQVNFANGDTFNIGGVTNLAYNAISDSGVTNHGLSSDDDLYIEGNLEVDGTVYFDGGTSYTGNLDMNNYDIMDVDRIQATDSDGTQPYIDFQTQNNELALMATNVGIGQANPSYKLDVTGNGRFTTTLNIDSTANPGLTVGDGTTGYVKVGGSTIYDAAGNLILDSDTTEVEITDDLRVVGNDIFSSSNKVITFLGDDATFADNVIVTDSLTAGAGGFDVDDNGNIIDVGYYAGDGAMSIGSGTTFSADAALTINSGGSSDLTLNPAGGQVIFANGDTFNIGGATGRAYNSISDSAATTHSLNSDDDLYIEGNVEVDGTVYLDGTVEIGGPLTINDILNVEEINVGGGYSGTGLTINSSGDLLTKGDLYYVDTLATNGSIQVDYDATIDGTANIGLIDLGTNTIDDTSMTGNWNFNNGDLTNIDINSGTIDGTTIATSDITVGAGKTLDVSAGTLTLANDQISGNKVEGGTINAITITTLGSTTANIGGTANIGLIDLGTNTIDDTSMTGNWNFNNGDLTNIDINSGTIDGTTIATSDITVGAGKTLDVSAGTLTLANDQISGNKVEGGTINAITITTLGSTTANIGGTANIGLIDLGTNTIDDTSMTGNWNFNNGDLTNIDINSGTIDGTTIATSDITVGAGKTLDVSAGTLTLANDQISGNKVEGGTINAITITTLGSTTANIGGTANIGLIDLGTNTIDDTSMTGNWNFNNGDLTNIDINSGTIDGTPIGGATPSTGVFTDVDSPYFDVTSGNDYGLRFWNGNANYMISMGNDQDNDGTVTDYSMHHNMGTTAGRGFTFGSSNTAVSASINALTGTIHTDGDVDADGDVTAAGGQFGNIMVGRTGGDNRVTTTSGDLEVSSSSGNIVLIIG